MTEPLQLKTIEALQALVDDLQAMLDEADGFAALSFEDVRGLTLEAPKLEQATSALEALRLRTQEAIAALRGRSEERS